MSILKYSFFCLIFFSGILFSNDLTSTSKSKIVEQISDLLQKNYVFEEVGIACGKYINSNLADGNYDSVYDYEEFANQLTQDLQSISNDKHMRVRLTPLPEQEEVNPEIRRVKRLINQRERNNGFKRVEILDGNIGYIDMRGFTNYFQAQETGAQAMRFVQNTDALIFDMRKNGGGDPEMVRFICSYLFDKKTHLNSLYYRQTNQTTEFWTLENVPGEKMPEVPVFVLTSNYTFSGAEEFCYNLKTQKRALLIGETTGGGANPGDTFPLNAKLTIFIPTGKAINPVTGTNWEGTGVEPDIITTAEKALEIAIEKALPAAEAYRNQKIKNMVSLIEQTDEMLKEAVLSINNKNHEKARQLVFEALEGRLNSGMFGEPEFNMNGYRHLQNKAPELAVLIFEFNTIKFPRSANVFDSYGDGLKQVGRINDAIKSYKKAVQIAKDNNNNNLEIFVRNLKEAEKLL